MENINLEKILQEPNIFDNPRRRDGWSKDLVITAMREACRQVLELAAENAHAKDFIEGSTTIPALTPNIDIIVNKQSILDTINNIE